MKENELIYDVSAELERELGPKGSASRKAGKDNAWEEYKPEGLTKELINEIVNKYAK